MNARQISHASDDTLGPPGRSAADAAPQANAASAAAGGLAGQGAGDGKREQILQGARTVFRALGFDAASMDRIAREAGVSKGTLYVYFSSKEGLFAAMVREDHRAAAETLAELDEANPDVRAVLRAYGLDFLRRMLEPEHIALVRMVIAASVTLPRLGQIYFEAGPQAGINRLAAFLRDRSQRGQLAVADAELAAAHFYELCQGGVVKPLFFGAPSDSSEGTLARTIDIALDIFLGFYGVRDGSA